MCGNDTTATQTITIVDTTAPEFTYVPADYTAECSDSHLLEEATATDACGAVVIDVQADTTGLDDECTGAYVVTRTFTATDECGHATEAVQIITIEDTTAPEVEEGSDLIVECDGSGNSVDLQDWLNNNAGAAAEDNCGAIEWTHDFEALSDDCGATGSALVTFTATDDCGNASSTSATFTIVDTTAPEILGDQEIDVACDIYSPDSAYAEALDACGGVDFTWEDSPVSGGCTLPVAMYRRMYLAVDECGNADSLEQFISVIDTIAPLLTVPADYTAECDEELVYDSASATDNCSGADIAETRDTIPGSCPQSFSIVRTFTASDNCDNETVLTQTITVVDTTAPELTIPMDYTAECSEEHPLEDASATDNCGQVTITLATDTLEGGCAQAYTVTRTFTALDECGNSTSATQTIIIEDTTAPEFVEALPGNLTVECDAIPAPDTLTANDNCQAVNVMFEELEEAGSCANEATLTRTWTVSDDCGNSASHTQVITVIDTTAPELTLPANYTAECSDLHPLEDALAIDNCGDVTIEVEADTTYTCDNTYEVTRTFTATDACGNSTQGQQIINIQDTTAPEFVEALPADETVECSSVPEAAVLTAIDNCADVEVMFEEIQTDDEDGCAQTYTITRIWTVVDACGNDTSHTQVLNVVDTSAPVFSNIGGLMNGEIVSVPYDDEYGNATLPEIVDPTAFDNCQDAETCDSAATAEANAFLMDALGIEDTIDFISQVDATGINNPFLTGGAYTTGVITTPEVMADGQTCDNNPVEHGVRLFNFEGGEYYTTDEGSITVHNDGTIDLTMTVQMVDDPTASLIVSAQFGALLTWDEWLDTPGPESFKSDCGLGDHLEWKYTTLIDGSITGGGSLLGTELELTHQPMNEYFGFQFGEGANNENGNFGFSGWFYYQGTLVVDGNAGTEVMGSGDLFGDLDFMQDWSTTLTYCVTDCVGNQSLFSYTIESSGEVLNPLDEDGVQGGDSNDDTMITPKDLVSITSLHPNPTSGQTILVLDADEDVKVKVNLHDMSGNLVLPIMEGMLYEGWETSININLQGIESRMYQIRITAKEFVTTKKLLVTE